mmetsp:Transcript_44799/g.133880  ORF Transcript_44799/g.133880 Transcript_44799/m.133880 type:complete len:234 (+) Transcript_44799:165-866(+)
MATVLQLFEDLESETGLDLKQLREDAWRHQGRRQGHVLGQPVDALPELLLNTAVVGDLLVHSGGTWQRHHGRPAAVPGDPRVGRPVAAGRPAGGAHRRRPATSLVHAPCVANDIRVGVADLVGALLELLEHLHGLRNLQPQQVRHDLVEVQGVIGGDVPVEPLDPLDKPLLPRRLGRRRQILRRRSPALPLPATAAGRGALHAPAATAPVPPCARDDVGVGVPHGVGALLQIV